MTPRREVQCAVVITLVAAALRLWRLDAQSLWVDEWFAVADAQIALASIVELGDGEPALHKVLLQGLFALTGPSDWWARLPSALASVAAVWLIFDLGRRWIDGRSGLLAAGWLALHPLAIWYGQEARAYSFAVLAALGSARALGRAWAYRGWWQWALYAGWVSFGVGSHYYFVFVVAAHVVVLAMWQRRRPQAWSELAPAMILVAMAVAVWVPGLPADFGAQRAEDAAVLWSWSAIPYTILTLVGGLSWGPPPRLLHAAQAVGVAPLAVVLPYGASVGLALGLAAVLTTLAVGAGRRGASVAVLAIGPVLGPLVAGAILTGFRPRYALPALPFVLLWWAAGVRSRGPLLACVLVGALLTVEASAVMQMEDARYSREDLRAAAKWIAPQRDDGIVVLVGEGTSPFLHYMGTGWRTMVLQPRVVASENGIRALVHELTASGHPVFTVKARSWTVDPRGMLEQNLATVCALRQRTTLAGVEVSRWERASTANGEADTP